MENNASTILAIVVSAIIMFGYPLITMARKTDRAAQMVVEVATNEYTDKIRKKAIISLEDYSAYLGVLSSTGNAFDVQFELQRLDENATRKATFLDNAQHTKNTYATYYTTQVMQMMNDSDKGLLLKEGDIITVKVQNANKTIFQQLTKFAGENNVAGAIMAYSSGIVTTTGE